MFFTHSTYAESNQNVAVAQRVTLARVTLAQTSDPFIRTDVFKRVNKHD